MEQLPHNSDDDRDRGIPELEQLESSEIDLTGSIRQDNALADVIGDALAEAKEAEGGEVPEWGARALARALANQLDDPMSGALHHFAVTGRADPEGMARELADLYQRTTDDQLREWANWLGTHVIRMPDRANAAESASTAPPADYPFDGSALDKVGYYLRHAFAEADARGEVISPADAQAIASLLTSFLPPYSEMSRFAETGDAHPALIHEECQLIRGHDWNTTDIGTWLERFEQYLAAQTTLGGQADLAPAAGPDSPEVTAGIRAHGDAFRAYLQLPDVDPEHPDLLKNFQDFYVGSFDSMRDLLDKLTDMRKGMAAISKAAEDWGLEEFVTLNEVALSEAAHTVWDIIEYQGRLYVFM